MADPLWINVDAGAPAYAADELRRAHAMLLTQAVGDKFGARSGVHPAGANAVSLSGTTVTVLNLKGVLYPGLTTTAGPYIVQLPTHQWTLTAADGANPRKDIVVLRVYDDDEDASTRREVVTELITGTPAASPVEPSVPLEAVRLATIDVPQSGGGSATLTYNAPLTVAAGGVLPVRNDAELPGTDAGLYDGMVRWNQATDELQVHNGAATWETIASLEPDLVPGQLMVKLRRTTAQSFTNTLAGSTATAVSWNQEDYDLLGDWASTPNPTRFTASVPGWYMFHGCVSFDPNTTGGVRGSVWRKSGTVPNGAVCRTHVGTIGNASVSAPATSFAIDMNGTTDYVELCAVHDASTSLNCANSGFDPYMSVVYLGPL